MTGWQGMVGGAPEYPSVQVQRKVFIRGLQLARGPQGEVWQGLDILAGRGVDRDWVVTTGGGVVTTVGF